MRRVGRIGSRLTGWLTAPVLVALSFGWAAPARAVEPFLLNIGVLGGVGGPLDADSPDPGTSQRGLELQVGMYTEPHTLVQLRLGRLEFGDSDQLGDLFTPELEYATVAGEYRFYKNWYDSGLFLGLGAYRLSGERLAGGPADEETAIGLTGGITGDFEITHHVGVLGQLTGHYANLDQAQLFGTALVGIAVKF
jgi:hypothetical protein